MIEIVLPPVKAKTVSSTAVTATGTTFTGVNASLSVSNVVTMSAAVIPLPRAAERWTAKSSVLSAMLSSVVVREMVRGLIATPCGLYTSEEPAITDAVSNENSSRVPLPFCGPMVALAPPSCEVSTPAKSMSR